MVTPLMLDNLRDMRLSGQVISVGRSSAEVVVKMEGYDSSGGEDITYMIGDYRPLS